MIGVLIPAYNAEPTVGRAASGAIRHADRVLVVDDGSRDRTSAIAAGAGAEVIRHAVNRGKGAALATGFARLLGEGAEAVVTIDADLQHEPDDIPSLLETYR
ncbi:MAG TPA: glycosyltransferase family 2 protein, partial [Candidatus Polarisedimenticolia bacterium]|nr:glycosyltransferase family 2 protein [Candidatus Polarisedimenticolia bacterium]